MNLDIAREAIEYFDQIKNRCIAAKCVWMINPSDRDHILATLAEDNAEDIQKLIEEHYVVNK